MWEVVFDIKHGWRLVESLKGTASQVFISVGVGIGAKTISMLFFCISKNCRINSMVCSRFLSKILLTTFASTACLSVGNFDRASSMAFWTISRRVASTFLTSFSDRGSNLSTGLRSVLGLPFAWTTIKKNRKVTDWIVSLKNSLRTFLYDTYFMGTLLQSQRCTLKGGAKVWPFRPKNLLKVHLY